MNKKQPIIFIGHGSPMNIIQYNNFTKNLILLGKKLLTPKTILVISAHWETNGSFITSNDTPEQIYDFYGFPKDLYAVKYQPDGNPKLANEIESKMKNKINLSKDWGIDHGAWSVLKHIFPKADIPVIQLSLNINLSFTQHMDLAKELEFLRESDVLIIGSGNIVHNLRKISYDQNAATTEMAKRIDEKIKSYILKYDLESLTSLKDLNKNERYLLGATDEHYLPLLYIMALKEKKEKIEWIYEGFEHATISMRSFLVS